MPSVANTELLLCQRLAVSALHAPHDALGMPCHIPGPTVACAVRVDTVVLQVDVFLARRIPERDLRCLPHVARHDTTANLIHDVHDGSNGDRLADEWLEGFTDRLPSQQNNVSPCGLAVQWVRAQHSSHIHHVAIQGMLHPNTRHRNHGWEIQLAVSRSNQTGVPDGCLAKPPTGRARCPPSLPVCPRQRMGRGHVIHWGLSQQHCQLPGEARREYRAIRSYTHAEVAKGCGPWCQIPRPHRALRRP